MDISVQKTPRFYTSVLSFFSIRLIWKFYPEFPSPFFFLPFVYLLLLPHVGSVQPSFLPVAYRCSGKGLVTK